MKNMSHSESFPPMFRQANIPLYHGHEEDVCNDEGVIGSDPLPVIDFRCIHEEKEKLHEACADWGIFRLVNHGIPSSLLKQLHETSKQVFSNSFESKQRVFRNTPMTYFWGTPALNSKGVALRPKSVNWMEGFNVPLSQLSLHTHANKDDDDDDDPLLTDFRYLLQEYGKHQSRLAETIYTAITNKLNEVRVEHPRNSSTYLSLSTGSLRVYRYPPVGQPDESSWGMEVHTDSSLLSILNQDLVGGLQYCRHDHWLHVHPIPDTLIVNLGDMMQAISNDVYKSVKHRVRLNKHKERLSVGYFVFPDDDTLIHTPVYKPFSYSEFRAHVQQDYNDLGFKVGLQRFRRPN